MAIAGLAPLLLLAGPAAAPAPDLTADQALSRYRSQFAPVRQLDCPRDSGDIVVCGRSGPDPNRPPIPYEPKPGDHVRLLPGEPPSAAASLGAMCTWNCPEPIEGNIRNIFKGIAHLFGKDD